MSISYSVLYQATVRDVRLHLMAQPISSLVKASLGTFYNLLESFQFEDVQNGVHGDEIALSRLSDELGRLRV